LKRLLEIGLRSCSILTVHTELILLVDIDEYAKELSRYIHLNPVRPKRAKTLEEYDWSSYQFYIGAKKPPE